ncbi:GAF and ANTAR domain-containing protein [Flexivirga alba]|uniref:GAF and ANTAR domain-containing protein n=1 Tax=Flexivirga alba TaxID=702742 RepID=A0ABW2AJW0_9MICO
MDDLSRLRATLDAVMRADGDDPTTATTVAEIGSRALPGDGAAITLMSSDTQRHTLTATDEVIIAVEQAQHIVGEGPSLDAFTRARPVLVPDLGHAEWQAAWPGLIDRLARLPVAALFAFPMRLGATVIGIALCYSRAAGELDRDDLAFALGASDILTAALSQVGEKWVLVDGHDGAWLGDGIPGSRVVHQATGMSMVQLGGVPSAIAFARLRAHAFAHGRTLEDVSADIVARRLVLQADDTGPP